MEPLIRSHLEEGETECRWCFAIDMARIKGDIIATYNYPDATLVHLSCSRCRGEFTLYFPAWGECYVKERIRKLHPELEVDDTLFNKINDHLWPEYGVCEFMVDRDKQIRKALSKDKR